MDVLIEHVPWLLFGIAIVSKAVDIARIDRRLPRDAKNGGKLGFLIGELGIEYIADCKDIADQRPPHVGEQRYMASIPSLRMARGNLVFGASATVLGAAEVAGVFVLLAAGVDVLESGAAPTGAWAAGASAFSPNPRDAVALFRSPSSSLI